MVGKLKLWSPLATMVALGLMSHGAVAQVFQTDAAQTPLPQPVGESELNLVTNSWGWNVDTPVNWDADGNEISNEMLTFGDFYPTFENGDAITLEGLFKWRGETLDPVADARTEPGHFSPQCGFTGQLLLLGGNCQVAFGWYNIDDPNSTTPPAPGEIHEFIPSDLFQDLDCRDQNCDPKTDGFCPLAWDNVAPRRLNCEGWQPLVFDAGAIQEDPDYRGGQVGFAVIGNPNSGKCTESKFSLRGQNQKNASGEAWVTTLVYQSTVDPEGFYLAFEDLPMSEADWKQTGVQGDTATNDGDFNDFVFYVTGLGCEGGGDSCDTGLLGACSLGRTDCAAEGQTGMCRPIIQPGAEICDNVDNDCNGTVDDGEGLCSEGLVCDKGSCVEPCGGGEFACEVGFACNSQGICIDAACAEVVCEAGEACRQGVCVGACEGVTCPVGQECQLGRCVDPCAGIECPAGRVCDRGLCLSNCSCRGCDAGLTCAADGRCIDSACDDVVCDGGLVCQLGQCVDACEGVVCPGGGVCMNGSCSDPVTGNTSSGSGSGGTFSIDGGNNINGISTAASSTSPSNGNGSGTSGGSARPASETSGCSCRVAAPNSGGWSLALLALAAGVIAARRRRAA
ncbi:MAG TPA: MYXO-CTERM sorting domain-containing protein [Polyangiaceae bacterium]